MTDETIGNVPILILGNKIDRPEAISEERLREMFGLYGQTTGKVSERRREPRPWPWVVAALTLPACVCVCPSGHHSHEGAEHKTTGGVHVQRVEAAGLRRRVPLALQLHRVKGASAATAIIKGGGGMLNPATRDAHHQHHHHNHHTRLHCPLTPVCLHVQRNQSQLDPNRLLSVEHLVQHLENQICAQTHTNTHTPLYFFFPPLPLSCHPLSVRVKAS